MTTDKDRKTVIISTKVDRDTADRVRRMAEERDLTTSAMVERILRAFSVADSYVADAPRGYADSKRAEIAWRIDDAINKSTKGTDE